MRSYPSEMRQLSHLARGIWGCVRPPRYINGLKHFCHFFLDPISCSLGQYLGQHSTSVIGYLALTTTSTPHSLHFNTLTGSNSIHLTDYVEEQKHIQVFYYHDPRLE